MSLPATCGKGECCGNPARCDDERTREVVLAKVPYAETLRARDERAREAASRLRDGRGDE